MTNDKAIETVFTEADDDAHMDGHARMMVGSEPVAASLAPQSDTRGEVTADAIRSKSLPAQTNPFCLACTAVGMSHCAYPDECGQVVHPISNERLEEIATEEWCEIEECNAMAKELMLFRKNRQKAGKR